MEEDRGKEWKCRAGTSTVVGLTVLTGLGIGQANRRDNDIMEGGRGAGMTWPRGMALRAAGSKRMQQT